MYVASKKEHFFSSSFWGLSTLFGLGLFVLNCGGETPPAKSPVIESKKTQEEVHESLVMEQEFGSLNPWEVDQTWDSIKGKIASCHQSSFERLEVVSGDIGFFIRLGKDGKPKWVFAETSNLGDYTLENCMYDAIKKASWPKPKGGDGEIRKTFSFDAGEGRPPIHLEKAKGEKLAELLRQNKSALSCKQAGGGSYQITAYIEADGKLGSVVSAGISSSHAKAAEQAECIYRVVKELKPQSPGDYIAKVTFSF